MYRCSSTLLLFPGCNVENCERCKPGDADTCKRCIRRYRLQTDGTCTEGKGQLGLLPLTLLILYPCHASDIRPRNATMHSLHIAVTSAGQHGIKIVSILSTCLIVLNIDTILLDTYQECVNLTRVFSVLRLAHTGALQQCHFFSLQRRKLQKVSGKCCGHMHQVQKWLHPANGWILW